MLGGLTIVVSPLVALMQDQVAALRLNGVAAETINSGRDRRDNITSWKKVKAGFTPILYMAPERLMSERMLVALRELPVKLFAIDEAHCISQWGPSFRPEYEQLTRLRTLFPGLPIAALTATADKATREDIVDQLFNKKATVVVTGFDRPNIKLRVAGKHDWRRQMLSFLRTKKGDSGIIYCLSRRKTDDTAAFLIENGYVALPYHAGMEKSEREKNQDLFMTQEGVIMVATIAFGMGIDKPDVRFVAHMDLPKSIEAYYQETGRAGRDGEPADAWMIYGLQDVVLLQQMVQDNNSKQQIRIEQHKLNSMLAFCELTECRRQVLLRYFGETASDNCGACDNCVMPKPTFDGTTVVQKLLSAIYRTGQRFGANYVIDVLTGKQDDRISDFGHDQLAVYGVGKELSHNEWRSVVRQVVVRGLVEVDVSGYGGLRLHPDSRPILRGEETIYLSKDMTQPGPARSSKPSKVQAVDLDYDEDLFQLLKVLRTEIAQEEGIAPYMVFHDQTLKELAAYKPKDDRALLSINGIGDTKAQRFGQRFLTVLQD